MSVTGHFSRLDNADFPPFDPGTVWLVGAGPGAAGLMSLLGYYALGQADVVVYDALVSEALLKLANEKAELVFAGKRGGKPSHNQTDITQTLVDHANLGKRVLRLKGGDPFVFGRGGEEVTTLKAHGIGFRIVPGITAGVGGLAYAGIPATHRETNQSVLFLTGHDTEGELPHSIDWAEIAHKSPVIVMYMAVKHLHMIAERLIAAGRDGKDRVAIISHASLPTQTVVETSLSRALELDLSVIPTPAIVVLGEVSRFRGEIDWFVPHLRGHDFD